MAHDHSVGHGHCSGKFICVKAHTMDGLDQHPFSVLLCLYVSVRARSFFRVFGLFGRFEGGLFFCLLS